MGILEHDIQNALSFICNLKVAVFNAFLDNLFLRRIQCMHMKTISGKVVSGAKRGRKLGFPTANVRYAGRLRGIYAVRVAVNDKLYKGVANIGYAPTFNRKTKLLEVYIFNFSRNVTGKNIEVEIVKKLRDEKKFASAAALVKEIRNDVRKAKKALK